MSNINPVMNGGWYAGQRIDYYAQVSERISNHTARITVIGQGYVGLPLAAEFCHAGFRVTGLDIDKERVRTLNRGESLTPDVSDATLKVLRNTGYYRGFNSEVHNMLSS